jgi:mono/diheme cytochrome c family protein
MRCITALLAFSSLSLLSACVRHHAVHGPPEALVDPAPSPTTTQSSRATQSTGPLALFGKGASEIAVVADEDPPSVRAFNLAAGKEAWSVSLDGTPGHLTIAKDGRVFVAVRERNRVDVIEPSNVGVAKTFAKVCTEPVGVALTPDERVLLVACGWGHEVMAVSLSDPAPGRVLWRQDVPLEPRAILAVDDGTRAVVSHAVAGKASVIELDSHRAVAVNLAGSLGARRAKTDQAGPTLGGAVMSSSNGFALAEVDGTVLAPGFVTLASRGPGATVSYYGGGSSDEGIVFPIVAERAAKDRYIYTRVVARGFVPRGTRISKTAPNSLSPGAGPEVGCVSPRGIAIRLNGPPLPGHTQYEGPRGTRIIACPGNDTLIEQDETETVVRRLAMPSPSAVAIANERDVAVVWSQTTRNLSTVHLSDGSFDLIMEASGTPQTTAVLQRGKRLFERVDDDRITSDGRGCATCHPDGRADALTWGTPEGPRQTMMLGERLDGTAPYGWTRNMGTLHDYVGSTIQRLGGRGLDKQDMDAVVAYISSLRAPTTISTMTPSTIERGQKIFRSAEAGCSGCHTGPQFTDRQKHDVASASRDDRIKEFDTPSLRFVGHTAPYFHDGRFASLRTLLTSVDGTMGHTNHLSPTDLDALEAYLKSL